MKKIVFISFCFFLFATAVNAQYSRYIIRFTNKNGTPFTLSNPAAYLSAKAIERRTRQKLPVDSTDLPVSPTYIESVRTIPGVTVLNKSNWLNQICIRTTDPAALAKINSLPFVGTAFPIAAKVYTKSGNRSITEPFNASPLRLNTTNSALENVYNYGNTFDQVHLHAGEFLHNYKLTGQGITIAVLDGGFFGYKTNPAFDSVRLQNRISGEWDFVANEQSVNEDDAHGMYCLSIMAANRPGLMVGTAPKANYYLFRTEDAGSEYPVEEQNWAAAAERADSLGADMISSSLGYDDFDDPSFNHSYAQRNGNVSIVTRAADLAAKKGMIVMNSAGNSGNNSGESRYISCPADGDSVVAVGAVDRNGNIAAFSSWGPNGAGKRKPDIVSLGQGTTIAGINGNPVTGNGTSFSNPNVAGLIACLWQAFPDLTNMDIIDAVQKSAHKYNNPDDRFGYGIPDFKKAFSTLMTKSFQGNIANDKCITTFTWTGRDAAYVTYDIERRAASDTGFTRIGRINGKSDVLTVSGYTFKDTLPYVSPTAVEYRLKQLIGGDTALVLMSAAFNITEICNNDQRIIVSPNPFTSNIGVALNTAGAISRLSIALHNLKGQQLYFYQDAKPNGIFFHTIPAMHLPAGVYVLTIRDGRRIIFTNKVMK